MMAVVTRATRMLHKDSFLGAVCLSCQWPGAVHKLPGCPPTRLCLLDEFLTTLTCSKICPTRLSTKRTFVHTAARTRRRQGAVLQVLQKATAYTAHRASV